MLFRSQIFPAGIIDILAYHKESKCFVIIELKKDLLDANALIQGMSYLRYYQEVRKINYLYPKRKRKFALLLISKNFDLNLKKSIEFYRGLDFEDLKIYYQLFDFSIKEGIDFGYYLNDQNDYDNGLDQLRESLEVKAIYKLQEGF